MLAIREKNQKNTCNTREDIQDAIVALVSNSVKKVFQLEKSVTPVGMTPIFYLPCYQLDQCSVKIRKISKRTVEATLFYAQLFPVTTITLRC